MKIIAVIPEKYSDPHLLVEMTADEMAKIIGHDYKSQMTQGATAPGSQFDVGDAWDLLRKHRESRDALSVTGQTLRNLAALCDRQAPDLIASQPVTA